MTIEMWFIFFYLQVLKPLDACINYYYYSKVFGVNDLMREILGSVQKKWKQISLLKVDYT